MSIYKRLANRTSAGQSVGDLDSNQRVRKSLTVTAEDQPKRGSFPARMLVTTSAGSTQRLMAARQSVPK